MQIAFFVCNQRPSNFHQFRDTAATSFIINNFKAATVLGHLLFIALIWILGEHGNEVLQSFGFSKTLLFFVFWIFFWIELGEKIKKFENDQKFKKSQKFLKNLS